MKKDNIRITISMPCYGRPERTKRAIQCILNQTINNWEAFLMGDNCPYFQELIDSGYLDTIQKEQELKGNIIHYFNNRIHTGGYGYILTNLAIQEASGKYFIFFANDDIILPNHLQNYLEIENQISSIKYMYFDSWIDPIQKKRIAKLAPSEIGHSEIIVRTEFAKTLNNHGNHYGHDWDFIKEMIERGEGIKSKSKELTYRVMSVPSYGTRDIID